MNILMINRIQLILYKLAEKMINRVLEGYIKLLYKRKIKTKSVII